MSNLFAVVEIKDSVIKSVVGFLYPEKENAERHATSLSEKLEENYEAVSLEENEKFYFVDAGEKSCFATTKNGALSDEKFNGRGYHNDFVRYQNLSKGY